ncbi:hypothetical protein CDL15_Pgr026337 [Punica granatum]|nr:hypothetical protein CDL15_Pgr026337 [Punica granatum]
MTREESDGYFIVPDKDVELAAQKIMQLSDEDSNSVNDRRGRKKKGSLGFPSVSVTHAKMIEEIFGSEGEDDGGEVVEAGEVCEPRKKRKQRCRLLEDIYQVTKPMDNQRYLKEMMIKY